MAEARIDKWMWAVRIFKTRTIAAEACKKGRVTINGALVKAARMVKPGDVIQVKKPPITYSFKVLQAIEKRIGAKLVPEMMENVTTPDQYEILEMNRISGRSAASLTEHEEPDVLPKKIDEIWKSLQHQNLWTTLILNLISIAKTNRINA